MIAKEKKATQGNKRTGYSGHSHPQTQPNKGTSTCLDRRYGIRAQSAGDSFVTVSYPPTQARAQSAHNGLTSQVEVEHAFLGRARLAPCSSAHPARLAVRDLLDACQAVLEGGLAADRASLIIVEQASVDLLDGQRGGGLFFSLRDGN